MKIGNFDRNKKLKKHAHLMFFLLFCFPFYGALFAQHTYVSQGSLSEHILDRLEIKSGELPTEYFHSAGKSYRRMAIANYVDSFKVNKIGLSRQDYFNMSYLINDNFEWSNSEQSKTRKPYTVFKFPTLIWR
jgi:hypothetical protein